MLPWCSYNHSHTYYNIHRLELYGLRVNLRRIHHRLSLQATHNGYKYFLKENSLPSFWRRRQSSRGCCRPRIWARRPPSGHSVHPCTVSQQLRHFYWTFFAVFFHKYLRSFVHDKFFLVAEKWNLSTNTGLIWLTKRDTLYKHFNCSMN
mgnify:CR=1 FL=1